MSVALRFIVGDFYSTQRLVRRVAMGLHAAECVCEQIVWQTRTPFAHGRRAAPQNRIFAKIIASLIKGIAMRNAPARSSAPTLRPNGVHRILHLRRRRRRASTIDWQSRRCAASLCRRRVASRRRRHRYRPAAAMFALQKFEF